MKNVKNVNAVVHRDSVATTRGLIASNPLLTLWRTAIGKNRDLIGATWRRHREPLVMPSIVQQPSHEDAGIEAARS